MKNIMRTSSIEGHVRIDGETVSSLGYILPSVCYSTPPEVLEGNKMLLKQINQKGNEFVRFGGLFCENKEDGVYFSEEWDITIFAIDDELMTVKAGQKEKISQKTIDHITATYLERNSDM